MQPKSLTWPENKKPDREQILWMYGAAYYVDSSIFRREDLADFGLDFPKLKEFGLIRMSKPLSQLRRHVAALWKRMDKSQRTAFLIGRMSDHLEDIQKILHQIEVLTGAMPDVEEALGMVLLQTRAAAPAKLQKVLNDGTWRRWSRVGSTSS